MSTWAVSVTSLVFNFLELIMSSTRLHLAEETRFFAMNDESLPIQSDSRHDAPDWSSDPMEILMHKQELERLMLEAEMSLQH